VKADLTLLQLNRIIVHEIPTRLPGKREPLEDLSETDSPATDAQMIFFRKHIIGSLTARGHDVVAAPDTESPVPGCLHQCLSTDRHDFVALSCTIATHLWESQRVSTRAALLLVGEGSIKEGRCVVVVKLSGQDGVSATREKLDGKTTIGLHTVQNLILSDEHRVLKAALFVQEADGLDGIAGRISDNQRGYRPSEEVADFFLRRFLGCVYAEDPKRTTERFYSTFVKFVNESIDDSSKQADYLIAVHAEMKRASTSVNPAAFLDAHLEEEDVLAFQEYAKAQGVALRSFRKDISLVEKRMTRVAMTFQGGTLVLAPVVAAPEGENYQQVVELGSRTEINPEVSVEQLDDGRTRVQIEDKLKQIKNR